MRFIAMVMALTVASIASGANILVVESYHGEFAWDMDYKRGLEKVLAGNQITYFEMDTKRVSPDKYQEMADKAWALYEKIEPDVVVLGDDNALKFLGKKLGTTSTPTVYLGVNNNPRVYGVHGLANITGVLERPLLKKNISIVKKIIGPATKKGLIIFDNGTTSQASITGEFMGKDSMKIAGITVDLKQIGDIDQWKKVIAGADAAGYDFVILGLYHTIKDSAGKSVPASEVLSWTSENCKPPLFGFWSFSVGEGKTAGGMVIFGETQGVAAGMMVKKILNGAAPKSIAIVVGEKGELLFSTSALKKHKLTLPESIQKKARFLK